MSAVVTKFDPEFIRAGYVDAHVHVWTPDMERYPMVPGHTKDSINPLSFTPEQLFVHMMHSGISRVVLIQMSYYRDDNSYMVDMMRRYRGVFGGVGIVNENADPCAAMRRLAKDGVRGFRIVGGNGPPDAWLDGEGMTAMWKCGAEEGLAMCPLINPASLPALSRQCEKFPQTPVVIDHCARVGIGGLKKTDVEVLCSLARHKKVLVKLSAFYALSQVPRAYSDLTPLIRPLLNAYGPERLMWASDGPYQMMNGHTCKEALELIRSGLDFLSASDKEWILKKTAEKAFF